MADEAPQDVIIWSNGKPHIFPPGFDPKKAIAIVRAEGAGTETDDPATARANSWKETFKETARRALDVLPVGGAMVGGALAAPAAALTLNPVTGLLVDAAGVGLGAAAGQGLRDTIASATGLEPPVTMGNEALHMGGTGAVYGGMQAVTPGVGYWLKHPAEAIENVGKIPGGVRKLVWDQKVPALPVSKPAPVYSRPNMPMPPEPPLPEPVRPPAPPPTTPPPRPAPPPRPQEPWWKGPTAAPGNMPPPPPPPGAPPVTPVEDPMVEAVLRGNGGPPVAAAPVTPPEAPILENILKSQAAPEAPGGVPEPENILKFNRGSRSTDAPLADLQRAREAARAHDLATMPEETPVTPATDLPDPIGPVEDPIVEEAVKPKRVRPSRAKPATPPADAVTAEPPASTTSKAKGPKATRVSETYLEVRDRLAREHTDWTKAELDAESDRLSATRVPDHIKQWYGTKELKALKAGTQDVATTRSNLATLHGFSEEEIDALLPKE